MVKSAAKDEFLDAAIRIGRRALIAGDAAHQVMLACITEAAFHFRLARLPTELIVSILDMVVLESARIVPVSGEVCLECDPEPPAR